MKDPRIIDLARVLTRYSTRVKQGDKVQIEATDIPDEFVEALVAEVAAQGGIPLVTLRSNRIQRALFRAASEEQMALAGECDLFRMEKMDVYMGVRGFLNRDELGDVPADKMQLYMTRWFHPVHIDVRVPKTRWVVLRWPTSAMAQAASKSTESFEDFYFDVCTLDYERMSRAMDPLKELMDRTEQVHIVGPGETDLSFSLAGMHSIKCDGQYNIPDGECYTAPVKDSVNGVIAYNTPTHYQGAKFENVRLMFRDGKIVEATSSNTERLNHILDTDDGARFVGEFAIGVNPYIVDPMLDTLFDEKICGSFHFTPGSAYEDCDNGNRSSVHWDQVVIQTPAYGGGEMWFDGVLVRKDGLFVLPEIQGLNPENLKG
jgi:aminopeptidase